ncbi:MAG: class I SAM-dependent methyltransferase [Actinobacteria bacterium]|nr:class I SAM-dependent methyltransferase [Actinomycetota bacterium]MBU1942937.1 class I SAM-dependent methyltransferase [Actinomycetota bacterium]MBU2687317.1 class I SAM-dependent methyltransferase [Actinomycetota bacterium]
MDVVETRGRTLRWARLYDLGSGLLHVERPSGFFGKVLDLADLLPGESLLDCGCGPGHLPLAALERIGSEGKASGIDASPKMIERAKQNASRRGVEVDFRLAAMEDLPFEDETFDVVTTTLVLHHLPPDVLEDTMAEMVRVLTPGGRLLAVDFALATQRLRLMLHFSHHLSSGALDQALRLMEDAGLEEIETGPVSRLIGYARGMKPPLAA